MAKRDSAPKDGAGKSSSTRRSRRAQKLNPEQVAEARVRLEEAQVNAEPVVLASRHNFNPALSFCKPQKRDPILQLAKPILGAHSYSTFAGFVNRLHIEPLFSCDAKMLHGGAVAMYAIGRYGLMARVPLMLNPEGGVSVLKGDHIQDLSEWLDDLPEPVCCVTGEKGFEVQHEWYEATGRNFNLYGLPAELRYQIFELAFGYDVYPVAEDWRFGRGTADAEEYGSSKHALRKIVTSPREDMFTIEKSMSTKMWEYAHKLTRKCFLTCSLMCEYIERLPNAPLRLDTLQILELSFTNYEFALFFGMKAVPFRLHHDRITGRTWEGAMIIHNIPSLKHLFLRFRAPIVDYSSDPWVDLGFLREEYGLEPWPASSRGNRREWRGGYNCPSYHISCQRTLIDWVLTYAVEYIKHVPKVMLCGWIKDDVRQKWKNVLADECSGVHHDLAGPKQVIENWDIEDLGPSCHFEQPCNVLSSDLDRLLDFGTISRDIFLTKPRTMKAEKELEKLRKLYVSDDYSELNRRMKESRGHAEEVAGSELGAW